MITGEEMKKARRKIGKTQEQLAEEMNISLRQLSRFENNEYLERYDKFLQLVVALQLYKPIEEYKEEVQ
ncbi:MAG: helix-turn-helix domain-containing protein [Butyrivibrio sp.]